MFVLGAGQTDNVSLKAGNATGISSATPSITIQNSGTASITGSGDITLTAGENNSGPLGSVILKSQPAIVGSGASIDVGAGGDGGTGQGGSISLTGGDGTTGEPGGSITITGGGSFNGAGGNVILKGGSGTTQNGSIQIQSPSTFTSTATFGASVWTSTAVYSPEIAQEFSVSAGTSPSGSNGVWFYNLQPGYRYRVDYRFKKTTIGNFALQFNNDVGSNYNYNDLCEAYSGETTTTGGPASQIYLAEVVHGIYDGNWVVGTLEFEIPLDQNTRAIVNNIVSEGSSIPWHCSTGGDYNGASSVSSMHLYATAGTWSGKFVLSHKRWTN